MAGNVVKVGTVVDDIRNHIGRYSKDFITFPIGDPGTKKYALFINRSSPSDTMMLMVSKRDTIFRTPDGDSFNVMLTIFGLDKEKTNETLKEFEEKMPFKLREASEFIKKREQFFFKLVEEYFKKYV